ncbi:ice-binding family protein [Nocardioides sp. CN2-186]|uniref:ice-binding family protein n=1 Tax=Nocardioides tweenelious TaxID=3156607 RepID=UPI0032B509D4
MPPTRPHSRPRSQLRAVLVLATAALLVVAAGGPALAAQPPVGLGTATPYAVLAGTTVTNTGPSVISGDVGVSPGAAVTGFPPGQVNGGTIHAADAVALQAKTDLTTAYNDAAGRGPVVNVTSQDLGGRTLVAGVYSSASAMALTGTVTLDAQGDPDAVFVFQAGSTLNTASSSTVALIGGAQACNVYWQVGSSATIGTTTTFVGSVLALTSISLQTGATVQGRMLARNGQVSLDSNTITQPVCAAPTASPSVTPTATATSTPTSPPTSTPTSTSTGGPTAPGAGGSGGPGGGTGGPGVPGGPGGPGGPGIDTPIPTGHPGTGRLPDLGGGAGWLALGLLCFGGAGVAVIRGSRRPEATDPPVA